MKTKTEKYVRVKISIAPDAGLYVTSREDLQDGAFFERGFVGTPCDKAYQFEQIVNVDNKILSQRTCGYGRGCFWTDWS